MPSAPDELREKMIQRFGDIDAGPPLQWLLDRGFTEKGGLITGPRIMALTAEEADCIDFLFMEWDFSYGGG